MTSQGLYGALANGVRTEGLCPLRNRTPEPVTPEPNLDPEPQPIDDQPPFEPEVTTSDLPPVWLTLLGALVGASAGVAYQWKKTYEKK